MSDTPLTAAELVEARLLMEQTTQSAFPWAPSRAVEEFARLMREYRKRVASDTGQAT